MILTAVLSGVVDTLRLLAVAVLVFWIAGIISALNEPPLGDDDYFAIVKAYTATVLHIQKSQVRFVVIGHHYVIRVPVWCLPTPEHQAQIYLFVICLGKSRVCTDIINDIPKHAVPHIGPTTVLSYGR